MTALSPQQEQALAKIKAMYNDHDGFGANVIRVFGAAGTGKTTLAKHVGPALGLSRVHYGTFTGKAAHVLRSKGCAPVSTIHSGIYFPTTSQEAKERLEAARAELADMEYSLGLHDSGLLESDPDKARIVELESEIRVLEQEARRLTWEWNPDSEWASADLIILDEVSMVNAKLAADIEAYEVPILVLGDPAQLPPVEGGGYYTNATPDFELTEIHRQALESPVLSLATRVRLSTDRSLGLTRDDFTPPSIADALDHDQVLTWSNKRRWAMIKAMRQRLGYKEGEPVAGDRIMCLTNNKDLAVFNGQQFTVLASYPATLGPTLRVRDDEGRERDIPTYADGFMGQEMQEQAKNGGSGLKGNRMLATFAQAITCHKAQGSEWGSVYVVNELEAMMWVAGKNGGPANAAKQGRQWVYTAATRASERLTITTPVGKR